MITRWLCVFVFSLVLPMTMVCARGVQADFSKNFSGRLGDNPVKAHLTRRGNTIYGYYGYGSGNETDYVAGRTWVDGLISDKNHFQINAYPKGQESQKKHKFRDAFSKIEIFLW